MTKRHLQDKYAPPSDNWDEYINQRFPASVRINTIQDSRIIESFIEIYKELSEINNKLDRIHNCIGNDFVDK